MKNVVFYLSVAFLALWLLCNVADAAGQRNQCANGACAGASLMVLPAIPPQAPPLTIDVPVSIEVKAATTITHVQRPTAKINKAVGTAAIGAGKLLKKVGKLAIAPVRFIANRKPARKAIAAIIPGRRSRE